MGRKLLVAVLVALAVAPSAAARPTRLMPGVTYDRILRWTPAGPVTMHLVVATKPHG